MSQQQHFNQQLIASFTGKLLRNYFGKGPESVAVAIGKSYLTIYIRNFLTPAEQMLFEQGEEVLISRTRERILQAMLPELSTYIQDVAEVTLKEFYLDFTLENKTMMLVALLLDEAATSTECEYVIDVNPRKLLIIRQGVLTALEKELIREGHAELLKRIKRRLEKHALLRQLPGRVGAQGRTVIEAFVDWNFERDRSVSLLIMQP